MYSKIVFLVEGEEIDFHLHEVVRVVMRMLDKETGEPVHVIPQDQWDSIFEDIKNMGKSAFKAAKGKLDSILLMPVHLRDMKNPKQWLFAAQHFSKFTPKEGKAKPEGWWVSISNRLIRINNKVAREHFYVSDHGLLRDIIDELKEIAIDLNWIFDPKSTSAIIKAKSQINSLSPEELDIYKLKYADSIANASMEELKDFHPDKDENELKAIQERYKSDPEYREAQFHSSLIAVDYLIKVLLSKFAAFANRGKVIRMFPDNLPFADKIMKYIFLADLMKEINEGKHEFLYRPFFAYGNKDKGDAYREFVLSIEKYFAKKQARSEAELAGLMRKLLAGESLDDDSLIFLPNLTGAWFLAEVARNSCSLLTGLMLLDMIESNNRLMENGVNLYSWRHVLVHPRKPINSIDRVEIEDMYGDKIDLANFDGCYPMAHSGSVPHSRQKLDEGKKLNPLRQKEGRIVLHWLSLVLTQRHPQMKICLKTIETSPLTKTPSYKEIDKIDVLEQPSKSVKEDGKLYNKWNILTHIIKPLLKERLDKVENILNSPLKPPDLGASRIEKTSATTLVTDKLLPVVPSGEKQFYDKEIPDVVKEESLKAAQAQGKIGPRSIEGWILNDVEDKGNCFYLAAGHQLKLLNHPFIKTTPSGTNAHDRLRLLIQGDNFKDQEDADQAEIEMLMRKLNVIVAIVSTLHPQIDFVYYFINNQGDFASAKDIADLPRQPIIKLAFTGNHYLSVMIHSQTNLVVKSAIPINPFNSSSPITLAGDTHYILNKRVQEIVNRDESSLKRYAEMINQKQYGKALRTACNSCLPFKDKNTFDLIKVLLSYKDSLGINVNEINGELKSAIIYAATKGNQAVYDLLVANGANTDGTQELLQKSLEKTNSLSYKN